MEGEKTEQTPPQQQSIDGGEKSKRKRKVEEVQDDLFKEAREADSIFGAKTAVMVFGSDGKVSSSGNVDSVFDRFVSEMNDGDGDENDASDEEEEEEEKTAGEVVQEFCREYESAIVELKRVEAVKEVEEKKKKKAEEETLKKMKEYESAIVELMKKMEAEIKRR